MAPWRIRNLEDGDLDQVVRIWEEARDTAADPAATLTEVVSAIPAGLSPVPPDGSERRFRGLALAQVGRRGALRPWPEAVRAVGSLSGWCGY